MQVVHDPNMNNANNTDTTTFTIEECRSGGSAAHKYALAEVSPSGMVRNFSHHATIEAAFAECRPGARVFTRLAANDHCMVAY